MVIFITPYKNCALFQLICTGRKRYLCVLTQATFFNLLVCCLAWELNFRLFGINLPENIWIRVVEWISQALFTNATIEMKAADKKLTFITRYKTMPGFGASAFEYHLDWLMHIPSSQITLLYPSHELPSKSTLFHFMVCCWSVLAIVWHVLFVSAFLEICLSACRDAYWQCSYQQQHSIKTDSWCAVVFQFLLFSISRKKCALTLVL